MTNHLKAIMSVVLVLNTAILPAQTSSTSAARKTTKKTAAESETTRLLRELRDQMQSQQAQIDELKRQLADKDAKLTSTTQEMQTANQTAAAATAQAASVSSSVQANTDAVAALSSTVNDMKTVSTGLAQTVSDTKRDLNEKIDTPTTIHYKGVTITPIAFFAIENVYRTRALNADINTPFNATPYPGAAQAHTSELNFSGRPTRLGGLFEGNAGPFKLTGYFEADFQSAGITSNDNQSNSYTLRQRQAWGKAETNSGFGVTGGQMWSLVTETKKSTDARTENTPLLIDHQYNVGFSWARQGAIRFQQKFTNGLTLAMSLEEAQIIYSATNANANFFIGNLGAGGGLYNLSANYSSNVAPDVIVKATFDPKVGGHYEVGGLARFFRDRYYPGAAYATSTVPTTGTPAVGGTDNTKTGGGIFANVRFPVTHWVDFGLHGLAGTGVGRYGTSTLPDVTVHPDGTLAPIKGYHGLFSAEVHPNKNLDLFGYAGGEYAQRTVYLSTLGASAGKLIGYAPPTSTNAGCNTETLPTSTGNGLAGAAPYNPGVPASCLGATRVLMEGTAGFVYRAYNNPKGWGRLQYTVQYSYLTRGAWAGTGAAAGSVASPKGTNNMIFTSMRYYLP